MINLNSSIRMPMLLKFFLPFQIPVAFGASFLPRLSENFQEVQPADDFDAVFTPDKYTNGALQDTETNMAITDVLSDTTGFYVEIPTRMFANTAGEASNSGLQCTLLSSGLTAPGTRAFWLGVVEGQLRVHIGAIEGLPSEIGGGGQTINDEVGGPVGTIGSGGLDLVNKDKRIGVLMDTKNAMLEVYIDDLLVTSVVPVDHAVALDDSVFRAFANPQASTKSINVLFPWTSDISDTRAPISDTAFEKRTLTGIFGELSAVPASPAVLSCGVHSETEFRIRRIYTASQHKNYPLTDNPNPSCISYMNLNSKYHRKNTSSIRTIAIVIWVV